MSTTTVTDVHNIGDSMIKLEKVLWFALSALSSFWYYHYTTVGNYYASIFPKMQYTLYFCETWRNVSLILLIISLIMVVRKR